MNTLNKFRIALTALIGLSSMAFMAIPPVGAVPAKTPPDSFLKTKVYSVSQLIQQVQSDPKIRENYARQFNISPDKIIPYFKQNIVESYITKTGYYTCYCVRPNGLLYPARERFTVGTKVFALRNGEPVMKWACGNPLAKFLPVTNTKVVTKKVPVIVTKVSPSVETLVPAQAAEEVVPSETAVYQPKVPVFTAPMSGTRALITGGGAGLTPFLPLIPIALIPSLGGHHGSPGTTGGSTTSGSTTSGSTTSGSTTSGSTTSGSTTSGSTTSGSTTSGSTTSGSTTSGSTTSGSTTSGSTTSGSTTSGSTTSGSTTSGSTTSGSTTSGSTTSGSTTSGSTTSGSTTSGSTTSGSTTSGSTTAGSTTTGSTTTGSTTTGSTTAGTTPEPSSGSSLTFGFIGIAIAAFIASTKKSRESA